jgi:hypothetical protein
MVDQNWDVILLGAGQNNFALGAKFSARDVQTWREAYASIP